ncbi:MAG TPA: hypothetical protein VGX03_30605 [Candidatus Binatia bacterium]|nr:hypothetical protein [Candidatus Binatia bacterium]
MSQFFDDSERRAALLAKLSPVLEVTAHIRPRLLLVASFRDEGHVMMGVLYHIRKDAFQSRLRFRSSTYPDFSRRARWKRFTDPQAFETWKQEIVKEFATLAANLGAESTIRLEFLPPASDEEILQLLFSSPLPALLSA